MQLKSDLLLLAITVVIALSFDFLNGFHDAANSIATVVSTRVLSPRLAVLWAATFNFLAAFLLGTAVAKTIGQGMIRVEAVTQYVVISGLLGAIAWDLLTWLWGLPTSSSHALIGGYAGAAIVHSGFSVIIPQGWYKTLLFIVVAPITGLVLGFGLMVAIFWLLKNKAPQRIDSWFRRLQLLSAAAYSLGHGGNDAQKTMGIIASALFSAKYIGGWRIVHTMGSRITKLKPVGGFCAEFAGAITLFSTALAGIPVSTTHTITGAIVGVGATTRLSAVRWGVARQIIWAWILTIPAAAVMAALTFKLFQLLGIAG
jgi:PiT family inorganic phosphate transporter